MLAVDPGEGERTTPKLNFLICKGVRKWKIVAAAGFDCPAYFSVPCILSNNITFLRRTPPAPPLPVARGLSVIVVPVVPPHPLAWACDVAVPATRVIFRQTSACPKDWPCDSSSAIHSSSPELELKGLFFPALNHVR